MSVLRRGGGSTRRGIQQPLEAAWRALLSHNARATDGNLDVNAGFLRDDAVLAIVVLANHEDASVRDCRYAPPGSSCDDATSVFDAASTRWADPSIAQRFLRYAPGGAQDPTWPLARYVDPADLSAGFFSLKPGHPERVIFATIAGVPLDHQSPPGGCADAAEWDALLGAPGASRDDFAARDTSAAVRESGPEGPTTMQHGVADADCTARFELPACRREDTRPDTVNCIRQPSAQAGRRLVEVARRFDEAALCAGQPCHNGIVGSACRQDYSEVVERIALAIQSRLGPTSPVCASPPEPPTPPNTGCDPTYCSGSQISCSDDLCFSCYYSCSGDTCNSVCN